MSTWFDPRETKGKVERRNPVAVWKDALLIMRRGILTLCSTSRGNLTREHILDIESAKETGREAMHFSPEVSFQAALWETGGHGSHRLENASLARARWHQDRLPRSSHGHSFPWMATKRL